MSLRFQHIDPSRSFASADILSVTQDEQGFMWFASMLGGFARYDGYNFKTYQHDPNDPTTLSTNQINAIYADPQGGGIWVGTGVGLVWLDTSTDSLTVHRHEPGDLRSLPDSVVGPILRDRTGTLWVGTGKGLSQMDSKTGAFRTHSLQFENSEPESIKPTDSVWCLFEDSTGVLWVGTEGGGLLRYDRENDKFRRYLNDPEDSQSIPGNVIWSITEDRNGQLWVGTHRGLARMLDRQDAKFEIFHTNTMFPEIGSSNVVAVLEDQRGNLWASLGEAIIVRQSGSEDFQLRAYDPANQDSVGSGRIWALFEDQTGNLWTLSNTINWLVPTAQAFSLFPRDISIVDSGGFLLDSSDRFWLGGGDGLHGYDLGSGKWAHYEPFPGTEGYGDNIVGGIYEGSDGELWVTTTDRVNRFDPESGFSEAIDIEPTANCTLKDSDGLLWLCLPFTGLASYDLESGEIEVFSHDDSDPTSVSFDFGYTLLEDRSGFLWYGTHRGLNLFDRSTRSATRFFKDPEDSNSLSDNAIRAMYEDKQGRLWIGTQFGLNLLDTESFAFTRYINGKKAADNVITSIVSFDDGFLWLATEHGFAQFNPEDGQFVNYTYADGLSTQYIPNLQAGDNGLLYAYSYDGILQIDTKLLESNSIAPPMALTGFDLFNQPVTVSTGESPTPLTTEIGQLEHLELTYSDQVVSFTFSALDYRNPQRNQYQYRLDGLNTRWIETKASNRVATFTDLSPGKYTLQVRGSNQDGIWNEAGTSLGITVLPPPWKTWWAYTLYTLAFLVLLTSFIQWRTRLLRIRSRELETAVDERTQSLMRSEKTVKDQADSLQELLSLKERLFTNISHEFRTPLTLMLGPIDNALKDAERPEVVAQLDMAKRNGKRVLRLVDQLLELSRLSSEEPLKLSPQPLQPVVEVVSEAFRPYAREKGITLSVMTDDSLWVNCASDAIERILMNLVSNALKFTPKGGRVNVILREFEDSGPPGSAEVELTVFDTGKGIPHDMQQTIFERFKRADEFGEAVPGSGIGLALVKELTDAHDGKVVLKSEPGKGTVVTILLPRYEVKAGVQLKSDLVSSEALRLEIDTLEQPQAIVKEEGDGKDSGKPQLLVIEDNRDMQAYLHQMLSGHYEVEVAGDGEAGLAFAMEQIPDIVICDVMLPRKDGYQVAHDLKDDDRTSHIPIIMLTARSDEDSKLEGLRGQVDDFLTKPFNDEELMLRVANLLAIRDILKARYSGQLHSGEDPNSHLREPERRFLERLEVTLEENHQDADYTIAQMADDLAMSVRQLQRKLKALTDQQPGHYLRLYRLRQSLSLLQLGKRIGDVAYSVGFGSPAHYASCFRAQYGCTPTEYQERHMSAGSGQA